MESFIDFLSNKLGQTILNYRPVSGGDISKAFLVHTENRNYFVKINYNADALAMFMAEQKSLNAIAETQTIKTPKIIDCNKFEQSAYLLLEHIATQQPTDNDFEKFGKQLAKLHLVTTKEFGFDTDNFIGNLPQSNQKHKDWATFYAKERLVPQFTMALENNLLSTKEIPKETEIIKVIDNFCENKTPSLLHGDLWSGNFLISQNGKPYLIDPAVYYGHNEVDIAMTRLFGGFSPTFYKAYHDVIPKSNYYEDCIQLYQLYYLLVHLNLFGSSYYNSVKRIMKDYF